MGMDRRQPWLRSWSVLGISGLDQLRSSLFPVFFWSCNWSLARRNDQPPPCSVNFLTWKWALPTPAGSHFAHQGHTTVRIIAFHSILHWYSSNQTYVADTLHAILIPEYTICHGGHFYCTKTIQAMVAGLIHAFFVINSSQIHHICHHASSSTVSIRKMMNYLSYLNLP